MSEPRTWTIHVCADCGELAHSGDHCSKDRRRVWTEMRRVEVIELDPVLAILRRTYFLMTTGAVTTEADIEAIEAVEALLKAHGRLELPRVP